MANPLLDECRSLSDSQITCLSISCFGLFCHAGRDFANMHSAELQRVYASRGLEPDADFMFNLHHQITGWFNIGTSPPKESLQNLEEAYIDPDAGNFEHDGKVDWAGCQLYQCIYTLGKYSLLSFQGEIPADDIYREAELGVYKAVCNGLYNCSEPYSPHGKEMMAKLLSSAPYQQAMKDLEHVVNLAKEEKILPWGERKWDYDLLGLPFDASKGTDMS